LIGPRNAMLVGGLGCVAVALAVSRAIPAVLRYRTDDGPAEDAGDELAGRVATAD
jgi:hypothetical protein